ncbi:DapH/DapD/GlmU-related protein [Nocardioides houyundeii]|uniref:acyltransferase n=1 Tax=Nocardioides houyundeii TaxID=2045452 RepID=UPI003BAEDBAF
MANWSGVGDRTVIDARGTIGVRIGEGTRLGRYGVITTTSHLSRYGVGVVIGKRSGVGDGFHLGASGGVEIGDDVIIGPGFSAHSQEHNYGDHSLPIREQGTNEAPIIVGNDCWIGSKVTLLAGCSLGERTIVASGAVVKGTFPGGVILGGVPARIIRKL